MNLEKMEFRFTVRVALDGVMTDHSTGPLHLTGMSNENVNMLPLTHNCFYLIIYGLKHLYFTLRVITVAVKSFASQLITLVFISNRLRSVMTVETATSILQLLSIYKAAPAGRPTTLPGVEDKTAVQILTQYHGVMLHGVSPRATIGDGNCAYRLLELLFTELMCKTFNYE
jgi:hypothetical protein